MAKLEIEPTTYLRAQTELVNKQRKQRNHSSSLTLKFEVLHAQIAFKLIHYFLTHTEHDQDVKLSVSPVFWPNVLHVRTQQQAGVTSGWEERERDR